MTNQELNTQLYQKMFAEQSQFRDWLLSQPPEEILNHAYEYVVREDIVLSLEENDLLDKQCEALLTSPCPLGDVFVDTCKELSFYDTGVTAKYGDKLLTLSTCEYAQTNGRLVVVAKKI